MGSTNRNVWMQLTYDILSKTVEVLYCTSDNDPSHWMSNKTDFVWSLQYLHILCNLISQSSSHIIKTLISFTYIWTTYKCFDFVSGLQAHFHFNHIISVCFVAMNQDNDVLMVFRDIFCFYQIRNLIDILKNFDSFGLILKKM